MAERLPPGAFKHGRSGSMSLARLDIPNGAHGSSTLDALGPLGTEGLGPHLPQTSPSAATPSVLDVEANGVASPQSASSPLSGRGSQRLGSPQSTSSPRAGTEGHMGSVRVATRLGEGDTNGHDTGQRHEDSTRSSGTSVSTENGREPETEWVEQDEPGVYITLTALPGGGKDLKRVRFRCGFSSSDILTFSSCNAFAERCCAMLVWFGTRQV
jgi:hypothetical protein